MVDISNWRRRSTGCILSHESARLETEDRWKGAQTRGRGHGNRDKNAGLSRVREDENVRLLL
jgi:hypothetical protein